jgi:penicillin-binding protein 2
MLISVFTFLLANLINLQIVEGARNYAIASKTNQSSVKSVAPRGIIYDANGEKLAYNIASYSIYVKTNELQEDRENELFSKLSVLLKADSQQLLSQYRLKAYDSYGKKNNNIRVTINANLTYDQYYQLITDSDQYFATYINVEPLRYYDNGLPFANILGYTGDPDLNDIKNGIYSESQVGKIGLEQVYDSFLRGKEGLQIKEKDPISKQNKTYTVQEVQPGANLNLTIDEKWQKALYNALATRASEVNAMASAGVIINSDTGAIMALATYPSYDNNLFTKGISSKDYNALINDPKKPLVNRPISLQLPSGSIWKLIGATAALESGVVTPETKYYSNRCIELPGKITFCEADRAFFGSTDIYKALSHSSNLYFCNAAMLMNQKYKGPEYMLGFAQQYGLGQKTGIDLYGEASGTLPSPDLKWKLYQQPWYIGDDCNTIIGQGMVTVTPIQMAVAVSAINNGGKILKPYLVSTIKDDNDLLLKEFGPEVLRTITASQVTFDTIKKGMKQAVDGGGSGAALNGLPGNIIVKTGSSEASEIINGQRYTGAHSWVVGCFEYEGQHYCFTVMQQMGGRGYKTVPIMKYFINCLYSDFKGKCLTP